MLEVWRNIFEPKPLPDTAPELDKKLAKEFEDIQMVAKIARVAGYPFFVFEGKVYRNKNENTRTVGHEATGKTAEDFNVPDLFVILTPDRKECAYIALGVPLILTNHMQAVAHAERNGGIVELFFVAWPELQKAAREASPIIAAPKPAGGRIILPPGRG